MRSPVLEPRQFDWMLGAFAATLAAHLLWLPGWYSATLVAIVLARWLQRRAYARAWPAWIKLPLLIAVLGLVVVEFGNPFARQAGTAALVGLSALKLIESERRRDGLLVMTVSLFLVSVQFLFNQGIGITLYMVVPILLVFLALNEIAAPPGTRGGLAVQLGSLGREFLLLLAVVLPLTVFLFLSVPRLSEPLWGTRENQWESRTGLSDTMSPGSITELLGDDTPVFRASFPDGSPPKRSMYWRGPVLWNFDGQSWRVEPRMANPNDDRGRLKGPQPGSAGDVRYQVMLEPTDRRWLHTLDFATGFPAEASRSLEGTVTRNQRVSSLYAFSAASRLDQPVPVSAYPLLQRNYGLQVPDRLNPRTRALAEQWRAEVGDDPMALSNRALTHIRSEGFAYSLSPPPLVGAHRMDEFLFETREGFCEHYAAAFVLLMRNAGVPARVVTGYLGGAYNQIGDYWVVRNSDAHAWAEILVEGSGWVRVDPTGAIAPERVDQSGAFAGNTGGDSAWLQALRDRADAVQAWWNRNMVRFDSLRQQNLFSAIGFDPSDWRHMAGWIGGGLALFGLLTAAVFWLQRRRQPRDPALVLYQRFLRELARRGVSAGAAEGAGDLGRRASAALPTLAAQIQRVVEAYQATRYGRSGELSLPALREAVQAFRTESRAQPR